MNLLGGDEFELQAFHPHMMIMFLAVMAPFLSFTYICNANKTHNMFTLMLHLWFFFFDVNMCREGWKPIQMVVKYDNGTLMPLWVANFQFQNPLVF
jgi:hypothetical protein